jgi:CubicO group peptidase (beta-lactamase class C family)
VVDLWAGFMDRARTRPWQRDTLVNVYSVGKAMAALCALRLVQRGQLDLDAQVTRHWPGFGAHGKQATTVRMLLSHRAGLPAIRRPLTEHAMYDWALMTQALADETPFWEPGTRHGYHVNTFGFLVGEVVRRAGGARIAEVFRDEIAGPLGADFHFGLAAEHDARTADYLFDDPTPQVTLPPDADERQRMQYSAYFNPPGLSGLGTVNSRGFRAAEYPSTSGHANARAVARIYGALCSPGRDRAQLLDAQLLAHATEEASGGIDAVLDRPSRFGLGFQLTQPERPLGPGARGFGHFGAGGSLGFADPDAQLAFGYTMNLPGRGWQNPRNRALVDAVYGCL